jgi:hypothetical protein
MKKLLKFLNFFKRREIQKSNDFWHDFHFNKTESEKLEFWEKRKKIVSSHPVSANSLKYQMLLLNIPKIKYNIWKKNNNLI